MDPGELLPSDVRGLLADICDGIGEGVGEDLVGVYAVGSTAQRDRVAGSDIDVLVVVEGAVASLLDDLVGAVRDAVERSGEQRVECVVYDSRAVAAPTHPMPYALNLNVSPGRPPDVSPSGQPEHWYLLDVAMARRHALALVGPPAEEVLGEADVASVAQAIIDSLDWHEETAPTEPSTVLNACRGWMFLAGHGWASKTDAGRWAKEHWDSHVIDDALDARTSGKPCALDPDQTCALIEHVRSYARDHVPADDDPSG
ncbi:MAG TPA: aminoglycoside adenylyltransferase domain-containing protein [Nitriliruptorales bacterium]|nr:aminoglycoside adenylyltransferase domain-containing protein [Nitriliruptorales bacterium]